MKHAKKFASLLLALIMALALAVPAMATEGDTNPTVSVPETATGRTYEIYQIFTGDLSTKTEGDKTVKTLSNVKWGQNGTGTTGTAVDGNVLDALEAVLNDTDPNKLDVIEQYVTLSNPIDTISAGEAKSVDPGYYLIKDNGPAGDGESISLYVVQVTDNITISSKTNTTQFEKKVKDTNDSTGATSDWQDRADYDIGDDVPFQLKATLSDISNYDTYKVIFHDTLTAGLTIKEETIKVYIDREETDIFEVKVEGQQLTVSCDDVKGSVKDTGCVITVEYYATLNDQAVTGSTGNTNTAHLEYSNDPNHSGAGDTDNTGDTPDDTVVVFTFNTIVNKTDPDENPLEGAAFKLSKMGADGNVVKVVKEFEVAAGQTSFTFAGLDAGVYELVETTTPAGYNTINPVYFEIVAVYDETTDPHTLTSITAYEYDAVEKKIVTEDGEMKVWAEGNVSTTPATEETPEVAGGTVTANVVNQSGTVLPETGGIGTTIFYVVGGTLVAAAGILLVTKKRMSVK